MTEYTEQAVLVDSMRACSDGSCKGCMLYNYEFAEPRIACPDTLLSKGADVIETLFKRSENCEALEKENAELEDEVLRLRKELEELK